MQVLRCITIRAIRFPSKMVEIQEMVWGTGEDTIQTDG